MAHLLPPAGDCVILPHLEISVIWIVGADHRGSLSALQVVLTGTLRDCNLVSAAQVWHEMSQQEGRWEYELPPNRVGAVATADLVPRVISPDNRLQGPARCREQLPGQPNQYALADG